MNIAIIVLAGILFIYNVLQIKELKELRGKKTKAGNADELYKENGGELVDTPGCNTWYSKSKKEYEKWNMAYGANFGELLFLFLIIALSIVI